MNLKKYMRWAQAGVVGLVIAGLAACGGGGGSTGTPVGTAPGTPVTPVAVASIDMSASAATLPTGGGTLTVTAIVKNAANVALANVPITFAVSSGTLQAASATTDANGAATATLNTGNDQTSRVITVRTVANGTAGTLTVPVTGSTLTLAGNGSLLLSSGTTVYTAQALDSASHAIVGSVLTVRSALGNNVTATVATDATGSAKISYVPTIAGADTLSVTGVGLSASLGVSVSGQDFAIVAPAGGASVATNASQQFSARFRSGGAGVAGQTVTFNTTRGSVSPTSAVTDATGTASTTLSSSSSGPATLTASIGAIATATQTVQFVATSVASIVLQANPNAIPPNTAGSTTNKVSLIATVRDSSGNAVGNKTISFSAVDPSGGTITPGTANTDANGQASVSFISGTLSTPTNGVTATATDPVSGKSGSTTLTVSARSVFITINVGNTITNLDPNTYAKPFSVFVTDSNGAALANQPIVLSVIATQYRKGQLTFNGTNWDYAPAIVAAPAATPPVAGRLASPTAQCLNEDTNTNGILDAGEDTNGNGRLTPGGVVAVSSGTVTTDATGVAAFNLLYGEQYALWINSVITARATVAGTESSSTLGFPLTGSAGDFTDSAVPPAAVVSPFGTGSSCTDTL